MSDRTFLVAIKFTLGGNGEASGEYDVGAGNELSIKSIYQKSTGTFDIIDIADSFGNRYTNASTSVPIDGNFFTDIEADNNVDSQLDDVIVIKTNGKIQFTLKDTSGSANTVFIYLEGYLTQQ